PGENQARRGLPLKYLAPLALGAVLPPLVPAATDARLDDDIGPRRSPDGMLSRPPVADAVRKNLEGTVGVSRDDQTFRHGCGADGVRAHLSFSSSTSAPKRPNASPHMSSSHARTAPRPLGSIS